MTILMSSDGRTGASTRCFPNYSPYIDRPIPDPLSRYKLVLPFRDPPGEIRYTVDGSSMVTAQIVTRMYEPADHFMRVVVSPLSAVNHLVAH